MKVLTSSLDQRAVSSWMTFRNPGSGRVADDPLRVALTENDPPQREREEDVSIGSGPETQIDSFGSPSRTSSLSLGLSPFAHNFALDRTR